MKTPVNEGILGGDFPGAWVEMKGADVFVAKSMSLELDADPVEREMVMVEAFSVGFCLKEGIGGGKTEELCVELGRAIDVSVGVLVGVVEDAELWKPVALGWEIDEIRGGPNVGGLEGVLGVESDEAVGVLLGELIIDSVEDKVVVVVVIDSRGRVPLENGTSLRTNLS